MAVRSLIEPYSELLAYICHLRQAITSLDLSAEEVRSQAENLLARGNQAAKAIGASEEEVRLARFALCALIDELLMNASWRGRDQWARGLLQTKHFQTTNAGEEFFSYLSSIPQGQGALQELYYVCLCLGFKGKYCKPGDERIIAELKHALLSALKTPESPEPGSSAPLFPMGYPQEEPEAQVLGKGPGGLDKGQIILAAAPPILFLMLFLIYIFVLKGVTNDILGPILGLG